MQKKFIIIYFYLLSHIVIYLYLSPVVLIRVKTYFLRIFVKNDQPAIDEKTIIRLKWVKKAGD